MFGLGTTLRSAKILLDFANEDIKGNILDLGAKDCSLGQRLINPRIKYIPIDIKFEDTYPWDVIEADLNCGIPFESNYFDYVFASMVIEHVFNPINLLREIKRVLKPEGICIIALPNEDSLISKLSYLWDDCDSIEEQYYGHHWRFTFKNAKELLEKSGFEILDYSGRFGVTSKKLISIAPCILFKVRKK